MAYEPGGLVMPLFSRRQSSSASAVVTIGTVVSAVNTNTLSAYTFSSVSLGAANAGRVIVVGTSSGVEQTVLYQVLQSVVFQRLRLLSFSTKGMRTTEVLYGLLKSQRELRGMLL